jgi:hypothetical protein
LGRIDQLDSAECGSLAAPGRRGNPTRSARRNRGDWSRNPASHQPHRHPERGTIRAWNSYPNGQRQPAIRRVGAIRAFSAFLKVSYWYARQHYSKPRKPLFRTTGTLASRECFYRRPSGTSMARARTPIAHLNTVPAWRAAGQYRPRWMDDGRQCIRCVRRSPRPKLTLAPKETPRP